MQRAEIGKAIAIILTVIALIALAVLQKKGTSKIGTYFGPIMLAWFAMLIWGGLPQIAQHPGIMLAPFRIDCIYSLLTHDIPWWESWTLFGVTVLASLAAFGAGLLAATGGEALYADMGHFGRWPIVAAWFLVMIGLFANYMGQGVLLIQGGYTDAPFFGLYQHDPNTLLFMVGLTVAASLIAAQALFTGCFSLVAQAVRLRLVPRMRIEYTSDESASHVYVPAVNLFLLFGAIGFVLIFRDPDAMTYAYGMAVGTTMSITYTLIRRIYKEQRKATWYIDCCGAFIIALTLGAYSKLLESQLGLIPLCSMAVFTVAMTIWEQGQRIILAAEHRKDMPTFGELAQSKSSHGVIAPVMRVFMCSGGVKPSDPIPLSFLHYCREEGSIPSISVFVHVEPASHAYVSAGTDVALVEIHEVGGGLLNTFAVALHDLPPAPTPRPVLQRTADRIHKEPGIYGVLSREQLLDFLSGNTQHDHPDHHITMDGPQKVVLVRILQGRKDPPFLVPTLRYLGIVPFNAQQEPTQNQVAAKVVVNRSIILIDYETVWYTKLLVRSFNWIRNRVQTLPEHLGVAPSATMFVTLRIDLQGTHGGEPLSVRFTRWARNRIRRKIAQAPKPVLDYFRKKKVGMEAGTPEPTQPQQP